MLCVQHYFTITYTLTLQCPGQSVINHIQNISPHILIHIVSYIGCITSFHSNIHTYTAVSSGMKYIQNEFLFMLCVCTRGSLLQVSSRKTSFHSNIHTYTAVSSVMKYIQNETCTHCHIHCSVYCMQNIFEPYGVAPVSRIDKIAGLFCKRAL